MANLNVLVSVGDTPLAQPAYEQIKPVLQSEGVAEVGAWEEADLRLVLGGDGTMLHEAQKDIDRSPENRAPILGLKAGNPASKGMLLNAVDFSDLEAVRALLLENVEHRMPYLKVVARSVRDVVQEVYAFNDANSFRADSQAAAMRLSLDGRLQHERAMGDGFLVCTPQGSTAYNLNAGGTVASHPESMTLTGLNSRQLKSLMLGQSSQLELAVLEPDKRPQKLEVDGQLVMPDLGHLAVSTSVNHFSRLVFRPDLPFADKLVQEAMRH